jgi:hypothetical protein
LGGEISNKNIKFNQLTTKTARMNLLRRFSYLTLTGTTLLLLSGCAKTDQAVQGAWDNVTSLKNELAQLKVWKKTKGYQGITYFPTEKVVPTFQAQQVPVTCRVFAHLLVHIPEAFTGQEIAQAVEAEAMERGADMLLIGGTRRANNNQGPAFSYYGPTHPYKCRDHWNGWKFAYDDLVNQGEWVTMGYDEWGNQKAHFNSPLIIQAAFLRCPN